jgi:hypothetical protein
MTLRLHLCDFWPNFAVEEFWLLKLLREDFDVILDPKQPELVIFCNYGIEHLRYSCLKIFYSHENILANEHLCDASFCFRGSGSTHVYFPNLVECEYFDQVRTTKFHPPVSTWRETAKTRFCNFVYSNSRPQERVHFCRLLMTYQRVDSPGKVLNNCAPFDSHGYQYERKFEFLKNYRFTIAFENEGAPLYTTEKILHPLVVGSIPIYWGNPDVASLFNPKSFINCFEFSSFEEVVEYVKYVDQSDSVLHAYRSAPAILPSSPLWHLTTDFLKAKVAAVLRLRDERTVSHRAFFPALRAWTFLKFKLRNRLLHTFQSLAAAGTRRVNATL